MSTAHLMRAVMGASAGPPEDYVLWLNAAESGAVNAGGTWEDQSASGIDFSLTGTASVSATTGLNTDGGIAKVARIKSAIETPALSLCLWVRVRSLITSDRRSILNNHYPDATPTGYVLYQFGGAGEADDYVGVWIGTGADSGTTLNETGWAMPVDTWIHYALIANGVTVTLYRNGSQVAQTSFGSIGYDIAANPAFVRIGSDYSSDTGRRFYGDVDDVRIYPRGITTDELALIIAYNRGQ